MVSKQTLDKIIGFLISSGFEEQQMKPGLWLKGERPHIRLVDLTKSPIDFAISDGISRWTEGHGIAEMEEVQQVIEGIILLNEPKTQKPPKTCSCHSDNNKKEIHVHVHLHVHSDETVTVEVEK